MAINPIIAMQQFKDAKQQTNQVIPRGAQLIIEAGYHCGWQLEEIERNLREASITLTTEQVDAYYDHYHASVKE